MEYAAWVGAAIYAVFCNIGLRKARELEHAARMLGVRKWVR
jgi:hypothetical protein